MVKSVSSCCVRGRRVLSNPVTYDKFLDKIQQKEAEIPLHQMESEQPHQKEVLQQQQSVQQKNPQELLSVSMNDNVSQYTSDSTLIGLDLWKQLKRVTIPVFTGDKKTSEITEEITHIHAILIPSMDI